MKKTNRFKVFASLMLILSMVFTLAPSLSMAASDDIKIIVNGEQIKMDVKPFIRNGVIYEITTSMVKQSRKFLSQLKL